MGSPPQSGIPPAQRNFQRKFALRQVGSSKFVVPPTIERSKVRNNARLEKSLYRAARGARGTAVPLFREESRGTPSKGFLWATIILKHRYHLGRKLAALTLVLLVFASSAQALELRVSSLDGLALSAEVFSRRMKLSRGVYVASVPSQLDAEVSLGARTLRRRCAGPLHALAASCAAGRKTAMPAANLSTARLKAARCSPSRALELSILHGGKTKRPSAGREVRNV